MRKLQSMIAMLMFVTLVGCQFVVQKTTTGIPTTDTSTSITITTLSDGTTLITTTDGTTIAITTEGSTLLTTTEMSTTIATTTTLATTTLTTETTTSGTTSPYDSSYYKNSVGLNGDALKSSLHNIIKQMTKRTYDNAKYDLRVTDEDPNNSNNIILFYTGRSQAKTSFGPGVNDWNREHVWAKSHGNFGEVTGPGSDLFNLHPTDDSVNSSRGNLDFNDGGTSPVSDCSVCSYVSGVSFEPRDEVKGDVARVLFYMAVRYEGDDGFADLELNDSLNNDSEPYFGKLSTLLQWNEEDPVDSFEMNRNNIIFNQFQHNRNPFIDHPEWANLIWGQS